MLDDRQKFAAILLAAGQSSRFEDGAKLTHLINGKPLIAWSLAPLIESKFEQIIIVTGGHAKVINSLLTPFETQQENITTIHNETYNEGMSTSIASGMSLIKSNIEGVFICLADMPMIKVEIFTKLSNTYEEERDKQSNKTIFRPAYEGQPGHPVLFRKKHFSNLSSLDGDKGAKELIQQNKDELKLISVNSSDILIDIDKKEDLYKLQSKK